MIKLLTLDKFKCFSSSTVPLSNLTLLTGTNASGKSSFLHALVLLSQTFRDYEWSDRLMLNGDVLKLGTVTDVVDEISGRTSFAIEVEADNGQVKWIFSGDREHLSVGMVQVDINGQSVALTKPLHYLVPQHIVDDGILDVLAVIRDLSYLTAERIGPRNIYPIEDSVVAPGVGPKGEHAVSILEALKDREVSAGLEIQGCPPKLVRQVEQRMKQFFPGFEMELRRIQEANVATIGFRNSNATRFHRTINIGFGLTQVFPIVVAALVAEPNKLLVIENPEVHLHPSGQTQMGRFLCEVAKSGVQVIVETHSDHVLNGVRLSLKEGLIEPKHLAVHFFRALSPNWPQITSPVADELGLFDYWPVDFFDQYERDISSLLGWDSAQ